MTSRTGLLVALVGLALSACSSHDDGSVDQATACEALMRADCMKEIQCSPYLAQTLYANDVDACVAQGLPGCNSSASIPGNGSTPAFLKTCADAISAGSCADFTSKFPAACASPPGTLANGTSCYEDFQCKGGECSHPVSGGTSSCGTCAERPPPTAGCSADSDCPGAQLCTGVNSELPGNPLPSPATGRCADPAPVGAPCGGTTDPRCAGGLICLSAGDGGTEGTCATESTTPGGSCNGSYTDTGCGGGMLCLESVCVPITYVKVGETCWDGPPNLAGMAICAASNCIAGKCVAFTPTGGGCSAGAAGSCEPGVSCIQGFCTVYTEQNAAALCK